VLSPGTGTLVVLSPGTGTLAVLSPGTGTLVVLSGAGYAGPGGAGGERRGHGGQAAVYAWREAARVRLQALRPATPATDTVRLLTTL